MADLHSILERRISSLFDGTRLPSLYSVKEIFATAMHCIRYTDELKENNLSAIQRLARIALANGDDTFDKEVFNSVKKLIDHFAMRDYRNIAERSRQTVRDLLSIYPDAILRFSRQPRLLKEVMAHTEAVLRSHFHTQVLEAFRMSRFSEFPVDIFPIKVTTELLIIISAKAATETWSDFILPQAMGFMRAICEVKDSCELIPYMGRALKELLTKFGGQSDNDESLKNERANALYTKILAHAECPLYKPCHEGVAILIEATFRNGDFWMKSFLIERHVFEKMLNLFEDQQIDVICPLLDTVYVLCSMSYRHYFDHVIDKRLILKVIPYVAEKPKTDRRGCVRSKACKAVNTFLEFVAPQELMRTCEIGLLAQLIELLKSKKEWAVGDALRWLSCILREMKNQPNDLLFVRLQDLAIELRADVVLNELRQHRLPYIAHGSENLFKQFQFRQIMLYSPNLGFPKCSRS